MKITNNNSGVVLITVVVIALTIMILAVSLISTTTSQSLSSQHQIDRIKAEELAKGAHWFNYMQITTNGSSAIPLPTGLDGKTFTPTISTIPDAGPEGTDQFDIRIDY